jgi:hypothetical protein
MPPPSQKVWVIVFIVALVGLVLGLGIHAAIRKRDKTPQERAYDQFLNAPAFNRSQVVGLTGTWSVNVTNLALQLIWTSNSTNYIVWDNLIGTCGSNSVSFALLSNTNWFDSTNYTPFAQSHPTSYSVLASTNIFQDNLSLDNYTFNLVLYQGMLRIEQDGGDQGVWNNYQGISTPGILPPIPVWPSSQDAGDTVLWQLGTAINCAQFRSNGQLLVGSGANPFNPGNGFSSWFANLYNPTSC